MDEFTSRQMEMLKEAAEKRRESMNQAGVAYSGTQSKATNHEEYQRRLRAQMRQDSEIARDIKKERLDRAMKEWKQLIGPRFADAKAEDERTLKMINDRVQRIAAGGPLHRNGMVLTGKLGVGKTWTAYAYARQLVENGLMQPAELLHGTEIGLLTPLSLGYDRAEKIQQFLDSRYKFYLIDEVGRATFKTPEIRHEIWYAILNHAYENHIPVVVTTNKSTSEASAGTLDVKTNKRYANELEMWIGEAAYDRLKYMADGIIPAGENKRADASRLMDEGRTTGLEKEVPKPVQQSSEDDPFGDSTVPSRPSRTRSSTPPRASGGIGSLMPKRP